MVAFPLKAEIGLDTFLSGPRWAFDVFFIVEQDRLGILFEGEPREALSYFSSEGPRQV